MKLSRFITTVKGQVILGLIGVFLSFCSLLFSKFFPTTICFLIPDFLIVGFGILIASLMLLTVHLFGLFFCVGQSLSMKMRAIFYSIINVLMLAGASIIYVRSRRDLSDLTLPIVAICFALFTSLLIFTDFTKFSASRETVYSPLDQNIARVINKFLGTLHL